MNYITLRKALRDFHDDFDGLTWALSGDIAYSLLVGNDPRADHIDIGLKLNQYGKAGMRLEQEPVTNLGDNGRKTFSLHTSYRDIPVNIVTTSIDKHLDLFSHLHDIDIGSETYNIVPPAYLAAIFADLGYTDRLRELKELETFDERYLKRCIKMMGLSQQTVEA